VSSEPSDAELVARLRGREPGAFDEVYRLHGPRIFRFLHGLAGSRSVAEDLFQDTWLAAARNAHRLREDTQLLRWLFTIARNKHRNSLRFASVDRRRHEGARLDVAAARAPDEQADARARTDRLERSLARLPEAHREILLLYFVEELDTAQVAAVLELREDAARKRLSRARADLALLMDDSEPSGDKP
jgi:RNA polymerase sigma-70 factor (ECF subfamily)